MSKIKIKPDLNIHEENVGLRLISFPVESSTNALARNDRNIFLHKSDKKKEEE
ncbi:MAG: hypothetical protein F6K22_02805 [Okeania sp. SIO2F4]|uniref:hypothetical protein n=1 Tax=Okeania sp. SIO2F4 TaxID=2607790 RepID=UPI001429E1DF|nr:hypothetical protein [Okeania sp. SIO2F4]NES01847.1 hypothetical protein [Okeania sp. SIO2F4]